MSNSPELCIYQFHLWLKGISPMIWRRIWIKNDTTIADLHHIIQALMDWTNTHLHQFTIHGKAYGISYEGGMYFEDNPRKVKLSDFQFRLKERFSYEYNFYDHWHIELRFEKSLPFNDQKTYPLCIAGSRTAPPEDCGGVAKYMELDSHYSAGQIAEQFLELLELYEKGEIDGVCFQENTQRLHYWATRYQFNRRQVNQALQQCFNPDE